MTQATRESDMSTLLDFLSMPLDGCDEVFSRFAGLPGVVMHGHGRRRSLYLEGSRRKTDGRVLLVAHADTVWDSSYDDQVSLESGDPELEVVRGVIRSKNPKQGIGADDRAGVALLWLLRQTGHSILLTDMEEQGCLAAHSLRHNQPEVLRQMNRDHAFAIQFDRCGTDFKCYEVGSPEFRRYVKSVTGREEPDRRANSDITVLCNPSDTPIRMCGVNLGVGYHHEHSEDEHLIIREWTQTLSLSRRWLAQRQLPFFIH